MARWKRSTCGAATRNSVIDDFYLVQPAPFIRKIPVQISTIVLNEYLEYCSHNRCFSRSYLPGNRHYKKPAPNSSYLLKHGQEGPVGADSKNRRSSYTRKDVGNNGHVGQNTKEGETVIPLVLSSEAETKPLSPVTRKEINSPQFTWIKVRVWETETTMPRPLRSGHWMQKKSIIFAARELRDYL